ncbi:phosphonate ABC transporter, permease protein PhnE [Nesterenkonia sp. HG001]|uniref:phosphonate ABC transporter, permease protein PhnE n=1 Tax=Nesterenkonia sp. HG001 TaxID=2983207 RepID=UPI002AC41097|nr:phosphonate ABC transporter, permease protein PhnE [Nesterenkonia sp. HG001]MDZ5079141.1 phosphonate ABC transporter, permease protein PhnE [Nesterenkonia sp. HG001]
MSTVTAPSASPGRPSPGSRAGRPEKPRPGAAGYLGLVAVAVLLVLFFGWTSTSTLMLDLGFTRLPLYPGIGALVLVGVLALGWRTGTGELPMLGALAVIGVTWWGGSGIGFTLTPLWEDLRRAEPVLQGFMNPNWGFIWRVSDAWLVTLAMAVVATTVGCCIGLFLAMMASPVSSPNRGVSQFVKALNSVIRSIPDIGYGLLFVALLGGTAGGAGPMAGVMALVMFNIGIIAKLTGETIDAVDRGPLEAADASGANLLQRDRIAVVPQILPGYLSYSLYVFELNIRASVVLGIVGAGGIGSTISVQLSRFAYENISAIMIALVVVVLAVDYLSLTIRRRLT